MTRPGAGGGGMGFYRRVARPLLFRCDPEWGHTQTTTASLAGRIPPARALAARLCRPTDSRLRVTVAEITFPGPVGLAAGFDKNGRAVDFLTDLGFGGVEVGSVSADLSRGSRPRTRWLPGRGGGGRHREPDGVSNSA